MTIQWTELLYRMFNVSKTLQWTVQDRPEFIVKIEF